MFQPRENHSAPSQTAFAPPRHNYGFQCSVISALSSLRSASPSLARTNCSYSYAASAMFPRQQQIWQNLPAFFFVYRLRKHFAMEVFQRGPEPELHQQVIHKSLWIPKRRPFKGPGAIGCPARALSFVSASFIAAASTPASAFHADTIVSPCPGIRSFANCT